MDDDIVRETPWLNWDSPPAPLPPLPSDLVVVHGSTVQVLNENSYVLRVHTGDKCEGRPCVIHSPSDHSMRSLPLIWRWDRGIFERLCTHGLGHCDPDQIPYWFEQGGQARVDSEMIHGCDGCCAQP